MDLSGRPLLVLAMLAGCYSPHDAVSTGGGDESGSDTTDAMTSGPSTGAMTTASTTAPTSTGSPEGSDTDVSTSADDTAGDAPPELTSFSVNGSETPSEILEADLVEIQVAAMDDVGIDRVEFYDGDTLIAEFTEPPYHTEFLVTSTENGGHSYTAVAYDTAEQTAEAGPIPLSVTIDGGAVLELQDAGFEAVAPVGIGPHLVASDDHVNVVGANPYEGSGFTTSRLAVSRLTLGLSSTGVDYFPTSLNAQTAEHIQIGHGVADDDGGVLLPALVGTQGFNSPLQVFRADADDGSMTSVLALGASSGNSAGGLARTPGGSVIVNSDQLGVGAFDPDSLDEIWTADVSVGLSTSAALVRVAGAPDDSVVIVGNNGSGSVFARKLSSVGDIVWTRIIDEGVRDTPFHAVSSGGDVTLAVPVPDDDGAGVRLVSYDEDGSELSNVVVLPGVTFVVLDVTYDPQGQVIISGHRSPASGKDAWVARFSPGGTEIWSVFPNLGAGESSATGLAVRPDGRLYVSGMRNTADDFLIVTGTTWAAELSL